MRGLVEECNARRSNMAYAGFENTDHWEVVTGERR
jgi:hypothetical protein